MMRLAQVSLPDYGNIFWGTFFVVVLIVAFVVSIYLLFLGWLGRERSPRSSRLCFWTSLVVSLGFVGLIILSSVAGPQRGAPPLVALVLPGVIGSCSIYLLRLTRHCTTGARKKN